MAYPVTERMPHREAVVASPLEDVTEALVGEEVNLRVLVTSRHLVSCSLQFLAGETGKVNVLL